MRRSIWRALALSSTVLLAVGCLFEDEPGDEDTPGIKQVCELIRAADPRLRTALTYDPANRPRLAELVDAQGQSLISLWVPYCTLYR
ncbi:MAG TPA: hypothetical protein PLU22_15895, partial [Polyangiaceae bacterium]|nr:hypothetical protein [Polyangiaceae bacterium]